MNDMSSFNDYKNLTYEAVENFNKKEYKIALTKFKKMAKQNHTNTKVHELLSYIYLELNDIDNAQKEYEIFLSLFNERYGDSINTIDTFDHLLADTKQQNSTKELEKQVKSITKSNKIGSPLEDIEIISQLSLVYTAEGKYEEAEKILLDYKNKYLKHTQEQEKILQLNN